MSTDIRITVQKTFLMQITTGASSIYDQQAAALREYYSEK